MSESVIEVRPPEVIAAEINQIKRSTAQYVLLQSIEIGRLLVEAKQAVPFGDWSGWLEVNCAYSQSNANNLMRIYKEYGEDSQMSFFETNKLELYGNLNRSQAVALLALPSDEREEFVRENDVEKMSVSELEDAIRKVKEESEEKLRAAESLRDDAIKRAGDMLTAAQKAEAERDKAKKANKTVNEKLSAALADRDKLQMKLTELENKKAEISPEVRAKIEAEAEAHCAKDLEELMTANKKLKAAADPTAQKFSVYFEDFQSLFNKMKKIISDADETIGEKLRSALKFTLEKMEEGL